MAVDFPSSPTIGQVVTGTGVSWRWDGTAWVMASGLPSAHGAVALAQITADQGGIGGSAVDIAGLSVTFTATAGRRYRVTVHAYTYSTVAGDAMHIRIMNGAVQLASSQAVAASVPGYSLKQTCMYVFAPSATAVTTLKVQAMRSAGTGTITFVGNSGDPSFIMVEDVTYEGGGGSVATDQIVCRATSSSTTVGVGAGFIQTPFTTFNVNKGGFTIVSGDIVVPIPGVYLVHLRGAVSGPSNYILAVDGIDGFGAGDYRSWWVEITPPSGAYIHGGINTYGPRAMDLFGGAALRVSSYLRGAVTTPWSITVEATVVRA